MYEITTNVTHEIQRNTIKQTNSTTKFSLSKTDFLFSPLIPLRMAVAAEADLQEES
jgi:hypothetical protein